MITRIRTSAAAFVLAIGVLQSPLANAQGAADRDAKEVSSYVLTEAALAKYTRAVTNLQPLVKQMAQACDDNGDDGAATLSTVVARMDAVPGVRAALQSAGMSTREYVLFGFSVFQNGLAAWALSQPGGKLPPGVQMANVNFFRAHEAALKKLGEQTKSADCEAAEEDEAEADR